MRWSRPYLPGSPVLCWWRRKMARWGFASFTVSWTEWQRQIFTLPRCGDIVAALTVPAHFTHLHLVRGYWHIPLAEQDRERTAFLIPDGLFQLRIMPFGLTNASATFRRATNTTLHDRNRLATTWFTWMTLLSLLARMGTPSEARRGVAAASNSMQGTRGIDAGATVRFRHGKSSQTPKWSMYRGTDRHTVSRPTWAARDTPPIHPQLRRSDGAKRTDTGSPEIRLALNPGHGAREVGLRAVLAGPRKGSSATPPGAAHPWKELQSYGERAPWRLCGEWNTLSWGRASRCGRTTERWSEPMGQDSRWLERLAEFEFAINRPSTIGRLHRNADGLFRFPWTDGEACGSDDIVPGYHDGNVLTQGAAPDWTGGQEW